MRISDVQPNQKVRVKTTGKDYLVKGLAFPYNSFMARRMVSLIGLDRLVAARDLELITDVDE